MQTQDIAEMLEQIKQQAALNQMLHARDKRQDFSLINLEENHQVLTALDPANGDTSEVILDFEIIEPEPLAVQDLSQDEETEELSPGEIWALKRALKKELKFSLKKGQSFHQS